MMFFTVLLPIDREVPLSEVKRFIRAVKLPFLHSDADSCDATDASILADQQLLDESLASMAFVNDALFSREEVAQRYELEQARYRQDEYRYLDKDKQFPCSDKAAKGNGANIGWHNSDLRKVCNEKLFPSFRKETQKRVKPVRVPTAESTTSSAVVETAETMFLPSEAEVFGKAVKMQVVEGEQYAWYAAHNADPSRLKAVQGCRNWWWLRSPLDFDPVSKRPEFCCVSSDGAASAKPVDRRGGVSPCFCI